MKKIIYVLFILSIVIAACSSGDNSPENTPATIIASNSQIEPSSEPTELAEVKLEPQAGDSRTFMDGTTVVYIAAGEFTMGIKDGIDNPEQIVYTDGFWIYSTEVTMSQYDLCVATGACTPYANLETPFPDGSLQGTHPVVNVTHEQAQTYCQWAGGRLPTEAEWEKTARAPEGKMYPWGDEAPSCDRANYGDCLGGSSKPVTSYPDGQTPYQIFDMAGNVFEWVADWYADDYYAGSPSENPAGPVEGTSRSIRGGSYLSSADELQTFTRSQNDPNSPREDLGFRCIVEDENINFYAPMCIQLTSVGGEIQESSLDCPEVGVKTSSFCENGIPYISYSNYHEPGYTSLTPGIGQVNGMTNQEFNKVFQNCKSGNQNDDNSWTNYCAGPEGASFEVSSQALCKVIEAEKTCGENYEYDPDQQACVYAPKDGNGNDQGTSCPVGFDYDPNVLCCVANQELTIPLTCQPGYVHDPKTNSCVEIKNNQFYVKSEYALAVFPFCTISDKPEEKPDPEPDPSCVPDATGGGCP